MRAELLLGATQESHLTSAPSPDPQPPQPHLPGRPLQGPSPRGWSVQTTEFPGTPGSLLSAETKREIHAKLRRGLAGGREGSGQGVESGLRGFQAPGEWVLIGRQGTLPDSAGRSAHHAAH